VAEQAEHREHEQQQADRGARVEHVVRDQRSEYDAAFLVMDVLVVVHIVCVSVLGSRSRQGRIKESLDLEAAAIHGVTERLYGILMSAFTGS